MTIWIIGITVLVSYVAFKQDNVMDRLLFNAGKVYERHEWYRLLSYALVHANWGHLIINMLVFYSFGVVLEQRFEQLWGAKEGILFLLLYVGGAVISNGYSLFRHRKDFYYTAVGASGAVSAVLFCNVFFAPWTPVYFFGILPIPGILFGVLFLGYSYYMARKESDNIGHDAHFLGAVFGFVFPLMVQPNLIFDFLSMLFKLK